MIDRHLSGKKVYVTSYPSKQAVECKEAIISLYQTSNKVHDLISSPEEADFILIGQPGNYTPWNEYVSEILNKDLISKFPEKVYAVSFFRARHLFILRGIYESAQKSKFLKNRIRSGAYPSSSFNPIIRKAIQEEPIREHSQKKYLFSFIGRHVHESRAKIYQAKFNRDDIYIENSSDFNFWDEDHRDKNRHRLQRYFDVLCASKFSLCPRGIGPNSIRLYESMSLGICPVIISDEWRLPKGPNWQECSVTIKERDLDNVEEIIERHEDDFKTLGNNARRTYLEYFSDESYFNYIVSCCENIGQKQRLPEYYYWRVRYVVIAYVGIKNSIKKKKRNLIRTLARIKRLLIRWIVKLF